MRNLVILTGGIMLGIGLCIGLASLTPPEDARSQNIDNRKR